jgi:hypothetical protein
MAEDHIEDVVQLQSGVHRENLKTQQKNVKKICDYR